MNENITLKWKQNMACKQIDSLGVFTITDSDDEGEFENVEITDKGMSHTETIPQEHPKRKGKSNSYLLTTGLIMIVVAIITLVLWGSHGMQHVQENESGSFSGQGREKLAKSNRVITMSPMRNKATDEGGKWYVSPADDPIPVSIRLMQPSVMNVYPDGEEGCVALTADIYNASAILANKVIKRNVRWYHHRHWHRSRRHRERRAPPKNNAEGVRGEDAYGTNNQEADVDEADVIKSDGNHVFTGYGDILVVWDAVTGQEMSRTKMRETKALVRAEGSYQYEYYLPKARISGLLLDSASKRLVVIVSGYGSRYYRGSRYRYYYPFRPVLSDMGDTRVLLYDVSSLPTDGSELSLISFDTLDGKYCSARKINGVAHVARRSNVNTRSHITRSLSRYHDDFLWDNKTMYIAHATIKAKMLLPGFAQRLTDELKVISGGSDCSAVTRVALYASFEDDSNQDGFPDDVADAVLKSYLQVSSFEIASPPLEGEGSIALNTNTIGSFFPSRNSEIYASEDVFVVAGRGYHRDEATRSWGQSTYFLSYKLHDDGSAPTGLAIGKVPGYLLNQFSMDEHDGYFRVATTEKARWACVPIDSSRISTRSYHRRHCKWEMASKSKSQLAVMKFPQEDGEMELINVIDNLGVTEEIKSVRFFDNKAYLVTFMRMDPLYTIDFSDAENPNVTDELKISGFSSYLHPVGDDRLIAIGKEANETTGRITGFQITLFDVADLHHTKVLQRYTINQRWASSSAEGDHLAFRYLPTSKLLILPISIRTSWWTRDHKKVNEFDGFEVFYVADEGIEKRFSISMTGSTSLNRGCWYDAYLSPRSMVFDGDLTVVKGHGYLSYDLDTEQLRWKYNLDQNVNKNQCSSYWG